MEELEFYLSEAREMMDKSVTHTAQEISKIRAGKANPSMLDGLKVEYYGSETPINQVAGISTPDARTLMIKPWEKGMIEAIEKAIMKSDLGFNPQNDGEQVIINIPMLTEERRGQLVKQVRNECENGRISLRTVRKDINDSLKQLQKDGISEDEVKRAEEEVQKITDKHNQKIDDLLEKKEAEIMKI